MGLWWKPLLVPAAMGAVALLLVWFACRQHPSGDIVLETVGEEVQRKPLPISPEELEIAKSGNQAYGHRLTIEPPDKWSIADGSPFVCVGVDNTEGGRIGVPGNWLVYTRGALGLPPEMTFVEATRDGIPIPCDDRPLSPESYGGGTGSSAPRYLCVPRTPSDHGAGRSGADFEVDRRPFSEGWAVPGYWMVLGQRSEAT